MAMASVETDRGRIGYLESGSGESTPIIFLHGVGSDKRVWMPQLEHFGQSRRAVVFDYPGYGESEFIAAATREDFAHAIFAAMDSLTIERAHICGLSLGGIIAMEMAAADPGRCQSLIIADSFAVHPDGQAIHDRSVAASRSMTMKELAEARTGLLLGSAATEALRAEVIDTMAAIDPAAYRLGAAAVWLADQRQRAASIDAPVLILVGEEDAITPPNLSEQLRQMIGGSRITTIPAAGHLANIEQPGRFNAAVEDFLSEIG